MKKILSIGLMTLMVLALTWGLSFAAGVIRDSIADVLCADGHEDSVLSGTVSDIGRDESKEPGERGGSPLFIKETEGDGNVYAIYGIGTSDYWLTNFGVPMPSLYDKVTVRYRIFWDHIQGFPYYYAMSVTVYPEGSDPVTVYLRDSNTTDEDGTDDDCKPLWK